MLRAKSILWCVAQWHNMQSYLYGIKPYNVHIIWSYIQRRYSHLSTFDVELHLPLCICLSIQPNRNGKFSDTIRYHGPWAKMKAAKFRINLHSAYKIVRNIARRIEEMVIFHYESGNAETHSRLHTHTYKHKHSQRMPTMEKQQPRNRRTGSK